MGVGRPWSGHSRERRTDSTTPTTIVSTSTLAASTSTTDEVDGSHQTDVRPRFAALLRLPDEGSHAQLETFGGEEITALQLPFEMEPALWIRGAADGRLLVTGESSTVVYETDAQRGLVEGESRTDLFDVFGELTLVGSRDGADGWLMSIVGELSSSSVCSTRTAIVSLIAESRLVVLDDGYLEVLVDQGGECTRVDRVPVSTSIGRLSPDGAGGVVLWSTSEAGVILVSGDLSVRRLETSGDLREVSCALGRCLLTGQDWLSAVEIDEDPLIESPLSFKRSERTVVVALAD